MSPRLHILAPALAVAAFATAGELRAQTCPEGRISYIFVDNHSVFDTESLEEDQPFRWAYEVANTLHIRTSEDFIRDELLFRVGDCYDPFLLEDSERIIRRHGFIARVDVFGLRQPDGSWHVIVDTQDEWTTKVDLAVTFDEGLRFRGAQIEEENFLGEGYRVGAFLKERDERRDAGGVVSAPQLFGTRLQGTVQGGTTRIGEFVEQELFYPFVGEVGRVAFRQGYFHREGLFPYALGSATGTTHLLMPVTEERVEVTVAGRVGDPGNLTMFGLGVSRETLEFPGYPGSLEVALDNDFGERHPAPDSLVDAPREQTLHGAGTRLNLLFGQRNVSFVRRQGLDALRGVQDVPVGTELALTVGRSMGALSTGGNDPDDLYTRLKIFAGAAPERWTINGTLSVEGRQIFSGGRRGDGWRDLVAELDLLLYWQPGGSAGRHTFLWRVAGAGGWDMTLPFQLTLGGESGVRGYSDEHFPGGQRLIARVEDRIYVGWPFPDLFDLGVTLFGDLGRTWPGDVPFATDAGWRAAFGGGLRIGFPAGTRGVVRVDVALPLTNAPGRSGPILRISAVDLVGLAGELTDRQLTRSRTLTVGTDLLTQTRR